jgi:hypothetical protein
MAVCTTANTVNVGGNGMPILAAACTAANSNAIVR